MSRSRQREAWDRTAWLCAVIANHAFGAKRARQPRDFNPMAEREKLVMLTPAESIAYLDAALPQGQGKK